MMKQSQLLVVLREALQGQVSKTQAGYEEDADDQLCNTCLYYEPESETCERVKGTIDPEATCKLYEEK